MPPLCLQTIDNLEAWEVLCSRTLSQCFVPSSSDGPAGEFPCLGLPLCIVWPDQKFFLAWILWSKLLGGERLVPQSRPCLPSSAFFTVPHVSVDSSKVFLTFTEELWWKCINILPSSPHHEVPWAHRKVENTRLEVLLWGERSHNETGVNKCLNNYGVL